MIKIEFKVKGTTLKGNIFAPTSPLKSNPAILSIHGWTSEKRRSFQYAEALSKLGFVVMLFDMRGHGESGGDRKILTPQDFLVDCLAAYDYLTSVNGVNVEKISVMGNSFGGYLAAILSTKRKVQNLVLRAPADYKNESFTQLKEGNGHEDIKVTEWRSEPKKSTDTYALEALSKFKGKFLLIEMGKDMVIPHQTILNFLNAITDKNCATHVVVEDAPHSTKDGFFKNEITRILVDWFKHLHEED